jgi:hypothetical protein
MTNPQKKREIGREKIHRGREIQDPRVATLDSTPPAGGPQPGALLAVLRAERERPGGARSWEQHSRDNFFGLARPAGVALELDIRGSRHHGITIEGGGGGGFGGVQGRQQVAADPAAAVGVGDRGLRRRPFEDDI